MKKRSVFILLIITIIVSAGFTFNTYTKPHTMLFKNLIRFFADDDYDKLWKKVVEADNNGLPQSALDVVEQIYQKALSESNHDQMVKALIHRAKYKSRLEEDGYEKQLFALEEEIEKAQTPTKQLLQSMLAEMYWWYYESNRWRFSGRSATIEFDNKDIKTWDLNQLANKVIQLYNASLDDSERLQTLPITDYYKVVIDKGTKPENLRPTIYDFLAHRALEFYKNAEFNATRPAEQFNVNSEMYLQDAQTFADVIIQSDDTLSSLYHATLLAQNIIRFRLNDSNADAFVDAELNRMEFFYTQSNNPKKDSLFIQRMMAIASEYGSKTKNAGDAMYKIAQYYNNNSGLYKPLQANTLQYKDFKQKAYAICNEIGEKYAGSEAEKRAVQLKKVIENQYLSFQTEKYVIPNKKFAAFAEYQNIEKLFVRVAAISKEEVAKIYKKHYDGKYDENRDYKYYDDLLKSSTLVYKTEFAVPQDKDYNTHSLEFPLNELKIGHYMVIVADNPDFKYEKERATYTFVRATNLSYINRKLKNGNLEYYVLDRETGDAIKDVSAEAKYSKYDYVLRRYAEKTYGTYKTDKDGGLK